MNLFANKIKYSFLCDLAFSALEEGDCAIMAIARSTVQGSPSILRQRRKDRQTDRHTET